MYVIKSDGKYWCRENEQWGSKAQATKFAYKAQACEVFADYEFDNEVSIVKLGNPIQSDDDARKWLRENTLTWSIVEFTDGEWTVDVEMEDGELYDATAYSPMECVWKIRKELKK